MLVLIPQQARNDFVMLNPTMLLNKMSSCAYSSKGLSMNNQEEVLMFKTLCN